MGTTEPRPAWCRLMVGYSAYHYIYWYHTIHFSLYTYHYFTLDILDLSVDVILDILLCTLLDIIVLTDIIYLVHHGHGSINESLW